MSLRDFAVWYVGTWLGRWYTWGGDDPSGFDCSGLIVEVMKATGLLPRKVDYTAEGLRGLCVERGWCVGDEDLQPGCLVFWLAERDGREVAVHVEMVSLHRDICIGASDGGSKTRTLEDAIKHNAFIKARPWRSREGKRIFADPFSNIWKVGDDG